MNHYKRYDKAEAPRCFKCGEKLVLLWKSGYADGDGAYRGRCGHCGLLTWYDRKEGGLKMHGTLEEAKDRSKAIAREVFDIINGAEPELREALIQQFLQEHPTLQQEFVGVMQKLILAHAGRKYTDLRNEASVTWAKKVADLTEGYAGFPYI